MAVFVCEWEYVFFEEGDDVCGVHEGVVVVCASFAFASSSFHPWWVCHDCFILH